MSRGCVLKASACRLQVSLSCAVLYHIVSLQYLSRSSLHRLAGLPCRLFLSYGLQVVFEAVDMPCPGSFHFSHIADYIYDLCPLPDRDVGLCGRKFVLCLFGQCPGLCTICHSWQHTGVVHLSLQADGKVAFVASVVVLVVFLCITIGHRQSGKWRESLRLSSRPCSPSYIYNRLPPMFRSSSQALV